ncbi:MAG: SpoIIE family protein phosphatase [Bacteroidetes bacterium]|nr:SpoIIE family protein phosphatase [Bacteroidota bacterium]MBU1114914.1 SpoIIE family protein phosphatase [Bacteroidota bacterium]MBU1798389.1 SpoIIE family protein phosphatase [Bacteroidota bacterium]
MKISGLFIFVALLFFYSNSFSQSYDTVYVQLDSLKENPIELDSVWRYHSGDDSSWASPNFDASNWDTLKTWFHIDEISDSIWTGIGWFRKTIVVDSLLINQSIALQVFHYGASQIYWNGNLVHEFGQVGVDTSSEKIDQPNGIPIVINLDTNLVNTLAIRYSNQKSITDKDWMTRWFRGIGFQVGIRDVNKSFIDLIYEGRISAGANFGIAGMYLSLTVLYFFLFIFYARRIENLYYALFTLFISLVFISSFFNNAIFISLNVIVIAKIVAGLSFVYIFLFYLAFLNSIFYKKMTKVFWLFMVISLLYSILFFFSSMREIFGYFISIFIALTTLEGLRIIIVAIRKGLRNAWVIGGGVISFATLVIIIFGVAFLSSSHNIQINGILALIVFIVGLYSIPLSMSVYLAKEIAFTNKSLERQLNTVKELSAKELEHQKINAELEIKAERERVENERKTKELEEARNLQLSLLPKEIPEYFNHEIAVYMDTATEVGGDYYDFHVHDNILTVAIGDATGHGLNAGTMVTATKSLFNHFAESGDILDSMEKISSSLKKMNFRFLSMCFALLKFENGSVKISSAGMPPVYIYRKESGEVEEVLLKGMPLGAVNNFPYELVETKLKRGDVLLLLSDGFPELFNTDKELLGYDKVKEEFAKVAEENPNEIIEKLKTVICNWKGNLEINDDITFVIIKKK